MFFWFYQDLSFCFLLTSCSTSSHPEVFVGKGALKICSSFTGEHPSRSAISIKLLCNLQHIFRTPFPKNTPRLLPLVFIFRWIKNINFEFPCRTQWWYFRVNQDLIQDSVNGLKEDVRINLIFHKHVFTRGISEVVSLRNNVIS